MHLRYHDSNVGIESASGDGVMNRKNSGIIPRVIKCHPAGQRNRCRRSQLARVPLDVAVEIARELQP